MPGPGRTIKLVIVGESFVGKTSVRGQYISGQCSTGYKATIGTDFISKSVPHYKNPEENVTLQIWDTAGQERFSSLSAAFFRGADAVILMFDVNKPETLAALTKWWTNFKERAPVADEDAEEYCCVLVGNKIDLAEAGGGGKAKAKANGVNGVNGKSAVNDKGANSGKPGERVVVTEAQATAFMEELIPRKMETAVTPADELDFSDASSTATGGTDIEIGYAKANGYAGPSASASAAIDDDPPRSESPPTSKSESIHIRRADSTSAHPYAKPEEGREEEEERLSRAVGGGGGTMGGGTVNSTHTIYHTPASSLFESESFASALSSPFASVSSVDTVHLSPDATAAAAPSSPNGSASPEPGPGPGRASLHARRVTSTSSSSSSAPTITPSLYHRAHSSTTIAVAQTTPPHTPSRLTTSFLTLPSSATTNSDPTSTLSANSTHIHQPPPPLRRPALFFTSAKTGAGVAPVFEYIARRVVMRWEYVEAREARRMHVREATEAVRLAEERARGRWGRWGQKTGCCGT